jgi:hypothetical protein
MNRSHALARIAALVRFLVPAPEPNYCLRASRLSG